MRFVTKVRIFYSIKNFSTRAKYRKNNSKPSKTQKNLPNNHTNHKKEATESLFNDITEILGTGNLVFDKSVSQVSVSGSNEVCTPGVRRNDPEENEGGNDEVAVLGDTQVENLAGNDVSDVVRRITEVIRGDHGEISMEKRLDNSGFELSSDIVGNVLKRCFKVPNLATRFFDWVKVKNVSCVTTESYNTMLYMAGDSKNFESVDRLLKEMEEYNFVKDAKTWTIIFMHYGKARMIGKALTIFERMKRSGIEPDVEAYGLLIQILCKSKKGEIALEFYKEMMKKGFELNNSLYPKLLNCLAGCGNIDGVYLVVNDMMNVSNILEHDAYSYALKSFCIAGRIKEGLELIKGLNEKNVSLSPQFFEILVKGLCQANRIDDALEIVNIMKKRNVLNEAVYGVLVNGYLRRNDSSKALDLFHSMKEAGLTPLTTTYTELIQHLVNHCNMNEYEKGIALYNELLQTGVKLDTVAYTAMIAGHVRHGHISDAWKILRSMKEEGIIPTQKCFLIFIKELCKISTTANEIVKILLYMRDSNINIGQEISDYVISFMTRKEDTANLKQVKDILKPAKYCQEIKKSVEECQTDSSQGMIQNEGLLFLEPLKHAYNDEHLHDVCSILSSEKDWFSLEEDLKKLKICYTPALVLEILHVCGKYGSTALNFFTWVRKQPGYRHTTETYNLCIKIAGKGKDFKYMRYLFHEMQRNGCLVTPDTWTIMIMLYGRVGLTDIASRIFSEMKSSGCKPNANTYKYLLVSFCGKKGRKVEEAIKLFAEMIASGLIPDKELIEVCFNCFCETGHFEKAKKFLKPLQKVGFSTPLSYSLLIRSLCRKGKLEEALTLANDVKDDRYTLDHFTSGSLIHGLLKKGELDQALSRIDSMKEAGISPTAHVYTSLISYFCKAKEIDKALDVFKTMWEEGCYPTVVTYTALIHGYISTGNFEDAQKVFLRMKFKGPFPDFKAYTILIGSFCDNGKSQVAMELLSQMMNDGIVPSTINFQTVFFGLNREGKRDLAQTVMRIKRDVARKRKFGAS